MSLSTIPEIDQARAGKRVVFTNGVFDILHAGHVTYLQSARELGDILVVGLNTDASVRSLAKGADRPINTLENRAIVVAALRCVDFVLAFEEFTPEAIIASLKPDIHVKGGDYTLDQLPEAKVVQSYGGEVRILSILPGLSTTAILARLKNEE